MNIGILGFEMDSSNKGCEALTYSFLPILEEFEDLYPITIYVFNIHETMGQVPIRFKRITFENVVIRFKNVKFWKSYYSALKKCDVILDITHGDSFTDLYGEKWFVQTSLLKTCAILLKKPLVLLPQTYGPFRKRINLEWCKWILKKSLKAYCRDSTSYKFIKGKCSSNSNVSITSDLAFFLPYSKEAYDFNSIKSLKVGINVSGLLWNDANKNFFGLSVDYKKYCYEVIRFLKRNNYTIYLIPHVISDSREGENYYENDCRAIREIMKNNPDCVFCNDFETAIDVKNYIANMDILIAARMHASIAAFSSYVPCIPFSYSRKFTGVYNDLNYPYYIDGQLLSTQTAIQKTIEFISNRDVLFRRQKEALGDLEHKSALFKNDFHETLRNCIS